MALTAPTQPTWTPLDTGGQLAVAPEGSVADGVFIFASAESPTGFVRRVIDGTYRASWAGIFAGGVAADNASRLNTVLSNASVKEVIFDTPEGGDIPLSGSITFTNKVLSFSAGSAFTGTYTLVSPAIDAPYNQVIFKGTPTVTTPQSVSGKFSVWWWNVLPDGADISASLTRCVTSVNTSFQKSIIFPGAATNYVNTTATTIPSSVLCQFDSGAVIDSSAAAITGGVLDASYSQQIFTNNSIVNPSSVARDWISVKWFGALGNNTNNDQVAIQNTVNTVLRNNIIFTVVFLPGGHL